MSRPIAQLEGLSKRYRLGQLQSGYGRLTESMHNAAIRMLNRRDAEEPPERYLWALRGLDLEVDQGDVIGVVGRNGAGKTTLLKLLARITEPTEGRAVLHGRVASLLEVGTGFHPELTGRENVFLNGAILGMRRSEIVQKFDEIVEFAEVERFLDTPVKRYSSGMTVRLAFSVAAFLEPEILIIDEVLTVGDAAFQKKCLGKMSEVARGGRTVFFVSHNMGAVAELCTRALLLDHGEKMTEGSVPEVISAYAGLTASGEHEIDLEPVPGAPASITALSLADGTGTLTTSFDIADEVVMTIRYEVAERLHGLQVTATLARNVVDIVHSFDTDALDEIPDKDPGTYVARYRLPARFLKAGFYSVRVTAGTPQHLIQDLEAALTFEVDERSENTHMKGYRRDRQGHIISPGAWTTERVE